MFEDAPNVTVVEVPINDGWARDWGPSVRLRACPCLRVLQLQRQQVQSLPLGWGCTHPVMQLFCMLPNHLYAVCRRTSPSLLGISKVSWKAGADQLICRSGFMSVSVFSG